MKIPTLKELQQEMLNNLMDTLPKKVDTLDHDLIWDEFFITIGCQQVSKKDALKIADAIYEVWG